MALEAPIIIGHREDPHVVVVADALVARGHGPFIVDLESIMDDGDGSGLVIGDTGCLVNAEGESIDLDRPRAGWLRRFHRADWGLGVETGSVEALELGTWHSAYSWLIDAANVSWVTEPRALRGAESKLTQWRTARTLGVPYPRTMVTTSRGAVVAAFSEEVVVKPLGTGQFVAAGDVKTVYAEPMMPDDDRLRALSSAPFIIQERLHASRHLRVVTVGDRVWAAALDVQASAPADWRQSSANHSNFNEVNDVSPIVRDGAVAVARELGLSIRASEGR